MVTSHRLFNLRCKKIAKFLNEIFQNHLYFTFSVFVQKCSEHFLFVLWDLKGRPCPSTFILRTNISSIQFTLFHLKTRPHSPTFIQVSYLPISRGRSVQVPSSFNPANPRGLIAAPALLRFSGYGSAGRASETTTTPHGFVGGIGPSATSAVENLPLILIPYNFDSFFQYEWRSRARGEGMLAMKCLCWN